MSASLFGTGGLVNVSVNGSLIPQSFVGTAGQTLFNLTAFTYTLNTSSLLVFINGQKQVVSRDFIETSTSSFTLNEGVAAGDFVDVIGFPEIVENAEAGTLRADLADPTKGATLVYDAKTSTSSLSRTQAAINDDTRTIYDFLPSGFITTNDATTYVQAALNSGVSTVDFLGLALKHDQVTVPVGVWAKDVNSTKFTNAAGNLFLVNTRSTISGRLIGTGLTNTVQRGIYPAAAAVTDVNLNVEVSNFTIGVQPAPIAVAGSVNDPKRWFGYIYCHDIVGAVGVSEGYGVLLESAEDCNFVVRSKNIRRHAVYLSAGARRNTVDVNVDGCGNYALQLNATSTTQPSCIHNKVTIRAINLTTDVAGQSGALAIIGASHYNTCTVFCAGSATTYEAVRIEGGSVGIQADHPKGNKIVNGAIDGQFTGGDVIRLLNADGTHIRGNTIDAYATASVIATRRTGTNLSLHGGYFVDNTINAQAQAIKGIYNEINTVPSYIGLNDIRNNGAALRVDDSTGGKRVGYSRIATISGVTASIATVNSGDTTATLSDNIQISGRRTNVVLTGSSGTFFNVPISVVGVTVAPSETQATFRVYNGSGGAQTFNYEGWVQGD
jgi:hypothetical protein